MTVTEFWWCSDLSDRRKSEIVEWVNSLPKDKQKMIEELRRDAAEEAAADAAEAHEMEE